MNDLLVYLIITFVLLLPFQNWIGCFLKRRIKTLLGFCLWKGAQWCLSGITDAWAKGGRLILPSCFHEHRGSCWFWTHLQLLLNYFHVVSLQEVQLVRADPVQLRKQIGEEHSWQGFIAGSCVPDRTHTPTSGSSTFAKNNTNAIIYDSPSLQLFDIKVFTDGNNQMSHCICPVGIYPLRKHKHIWRVSWTPSHGDGTCPYWTPDLYTTSSCHNPNKLVFVSLTRFYILVGTFSVGTHQSWDSSQLARTCLMSMGKLSSYK